MNFKSWNDYRNKSNELNLYTKAHLKELGLKPNKDATFKICKVCTNGSWKKFQFYKIENTKEIKKREIITKDLEMNFNNICKSLYVINKSAKKSRDTKNTNYYLKNYKTIASAKTRQNKLYNLKNLVMEKMIDEKILTLKGYHTQFDNKLLYYTCNNYGFHMLSENDNVSHLKFLGDIESPIKAESKENRIKFNGAVKLLEKYIGQ